MIPAAFWVLALNCFTNSMMLTPWGPSAVPTGGAGLACPPGTCSFTTAVIGLAIVCFLYNVRRFRRTPTKPVVGMLLVRLELQIIQFHRGRPPEERHRHPHLALIRQHFFDGAAEIREGAFR